MTRPDFDQRGGARRIPRAKSLGEILSTPRRKLCHGQQWGAWRFDAVRLCLLYEKTIQGHSRVTYEIDLETCGHSSGVLDWICQISGKGWGRASVADLVEALQDIVDPQANFCSFAVWGGPRSDRHVPLEQMKAFLRERIDEPSEAETERTWAWAYGSETAPTPWMEGIEIGGTLNDSINGVVNR